MAKRRPDQQLTQNNWDEELERDEVGQFQKADESEMKQRVIRVAKRRIRSDETDGNESSAKPVSVFSGFSLLSNKSSTLGSDAAPSKPMFSFGSSFSSQPPAASAPFSASSSVTTPSFGGQLKVDDSKSSEFVTKLKELNDAVLSCIKGHIESGQACILTPIFKDYEKYVKELEGKNKNATAESPAKTNHANSTASTAPTASFSFSFNVPKPTTTADAESTTASIAASSIVVAPTQSSSATPMFSFGKPSTTFGTGSSGFSFSSAIQTTKPAESDKKTDGGTNGNTENAEDEDDEPPKVEYKPVVEDESFYSKRCKVFVKDAGDYKDRGTGTLYLKNVKDDKVQLIVRADTNLGNILLNILLSSASPAKQLKNNVVLVCIPTPESEPKPKSVLIRVKTQDDAKELLEEIEKHQ
ncbi:nuclear pore complex protein Nup50 [Sitodiplosis mosellana]|uniref:nuclear pore complex protein Nup50 n=1 Tax=Sitodiplosis mosellana TaxID=263140 RepID=UPI002444FBE3|nr:nuclear pore complex protein Nup50 [Sitodiplosis mosellana]